MCVGIKEQLEVLMFIASTNSASEIPITDSCLNMEFVNRFTNNQVRVYRLSTYKLGVLQLVFWYLQVAR